MTDGDKEALIRQYAAGEITWHALRERGFSDYVTRVTGFLWDRGRDRLWRQGIDLIGDDRGGQVGKGIEDGAMFGKSEGGELLDMTDDGFDDVAPVEQSLVEERHREAFHVAPDPRHQDKAAAEQFVREIRADVAFVAEQFADQVPGQLWHRRGVMDVAGRQCER